MCRIGTGIDPDHRAGVAERGPIPEPSSKLAGDYVEAQGDPRVLARVDRLPRFHIVVTLAVAVGVEDERRPALRFLLVASLLEHLWIEPAEHSRAYHSSAGPQGVVRILGEDQVVSREARADQSELAVCRIIH